MSTQWMFWILAAVFAAAGMVLVTRAMLWRTSPSRRCPSCWYDMSATEGHVCPECGHTATTERRLHRVRYRRTVLMGGLAVVMLGVLVGLVPTVRSGSWAPVVPLGVLVLVEPYYPGLVVREEVSGRLRAAGGVRDARLHRRFINILATTCDPSRAQWASELGSLVRPQGECSAIGQLVNSIDTALPEVSYTRLVAVSRIARDERADLSPFAADYERFIQSHVQAIAIAGLDSMSMFDAPDRRRLLCAALSRSEDPDRQVRNFALLAAAQLAREIPDEQWPRVMRVLSTSTAAGDVQRAAEIALVIDPSGAQSFEPLLAILSGQRPLAPDGFGTPIDARAGVLALLAKKRDRLSEADRSKVDFAVSLIEDQELSTLPVREKQHVQWAIDDWRGSDPRR